MKTKSAISIYVFCVDERTVYNYFVTITALEKAMGGVLSSCAQHFPYFLSPTEVLPVPPKHFWKVGGPLRADRFSVGREQKGKGGIVKMSPSYFLTWPAKTLRVFKVLFDTLLNTKHRPLCPGLVFYNSIPPSSHFHFLPLKDRSEKKNDRF